MNQNRSAHLESSGLDSLDPNAVRLRDASHFRAIIAASDRLEAAEQDLIEAISAARAAGDSWTVIGAALGTSKQNAQQRFGKRLRSRPDAAPPEPVEVGSRRLATGRLEIYGSRNVFSFRVKARNGVVVATSGTYKTKTAARDGVNALLRATHSAHVDDLTDQT